MVALLGLAAAVSLAIGEWLDAGIIIAIALANTALGYFQEGRAEGASRSLRQADGPDGHRPARWPHQAGQRRGAGPW